MLKTSLVSLASVAPAFRPRSESSGGPGRGGRPRGRYRDAGEDDRGKRQRHAGRRSEPAERHPVPGAAGRLGFALAPDSFFTILVFNNELRGPLPGSVGLIPQGPAPLPAPLASHAQLVVESTSWGGPSELVVRDGKTGFVFFNVEGHQYDYEAETHRLSVRAGRLLVSKEFAAELGRPSAAGSVVGEISMAATMRAIEITQLVDGEVESDSPAGSARRRDRARAGRHRRRPDRAGAVRQQQRNAGRPRRGNRLLQCRHRGPELVRLAEQRPPGDPAEPLSHERWRDERRTLRADRSVQRQACVHGLDRQHLRLWLQRRRRHPSGLRLLGSLRGQPEFGTQPGFARLDQSLYRRLPARRLGDAAQQPHRPHAHRPFAPDPGGDRRPEHGAESRAPPIMPKASTSRRTSMPGARRIPAQCNMYNNVSYRRYIGHRHGSPFSFSAGWRDGADAAGHQRPGPARPSPRSSRIRRMTASERWATR